MSEPGGYGSNQEEPGLITVKDQLVHVHLKIKDMISVIVFVIRDSMVK